MDPYRDTKPLANDFQHPGSYPVGQPNDYPMQGPTSQHTVICTQPTVVTVPAAQPRPDSVGPIIFSCVVFWCCCWPLGLVAFILAIVASSSNDNGSARGHLQAANILSGIGLAIGIIFWIVIVVLYVTVWSVAAKSLDELSEALNDVTMGY